ncbi:unnamed protein product [Pleuronectes platessa]|uniref:Uncharacterized protein n=1 Tax=Pleuronectes platessa TaxID=8262 RepID=A0A9N7TR83_PLEPL|nr:unnamed protein product [Pleuronectes platessa]
MSNSSGPITQRHDNRTLTTPHEQTAERVALPLCQNHTECLPGEVHFIPLFPPRDSDYGFVPPSSCPSFSPLCSNQRDAACLLGLTLFVAKLDVAQRQEILRSDTGTTTQTSPECSVEGGAGQKV